MSIASTRKGFTQAKFNEDASNVIFGEIFIISAAIGFYFSSWYIFGGLIIGLIVCMLIPVINIIMGVVLSFLWAVMGASMICFFQDVNLGDPTNFLAFLGSVFSTSASQVVGALLFLSGIGLHLGAIEWTRDVGDTDQRNFT